MKQQTQSGPEAMKIFMQEHPINGYPRKQRTYKVYDRGYDYVIVTDEGFHQRVSNLSILKKAIRYWRSAGFRRERGIDNVNGWPGYESWVNATGQIDGAL